MGQAPIPPQAHYLISNETRTKITLGEMRASGVRGLLVYCADYRCAHAVSISADQWSDDTLLADLEPRFVCAAYGHRGADIRSRFDEARPPA
jgi:hypothetical protein